MYYGLGAPLPRITGRGSYRMHRSELLMLAPCLRLPGNLGCFGFGPVVLNQREQRGGPEDNLRQGGVADGGLKGASGTVVCLTGGSGRGGCS